jgi:predicted short-subunit dehydrogenase-like oxidoreductase (DUF2520 family)
MVDHPAHRQIGIIGTGRVAQALALALCPHSAAPPLIWGRSANHLHAALERIGMGNQAADLASLAAACDVIAIAVTDDALDTVIADLARITPFAHAPLVFHVSGGSGVACLAPLAARGAITAAIHPAMTFTGDPFAEGQRMIGARFAITGASAQADQRATALVRLLGGVPVAIAEQHRPLYHAALCHGANHLVTLLAGSMQALHAAGVDDPAGLMAPLVRAALDNSLAQGFAALSGPLLRGDGMTIRRHLAAIDRDCAPLGPAYRAMALATLDELARTGRPSDLAQELIHD